MIFLLQFSPFSNCITHQENLLNLVLVCGHFTRRASLESKGISLKLNFFYGFLLFHFYFFDLTLTLTFFGLSCELLNKTSIYKYRNYFNIKPLLKPLITIGPCTTFLWQTNRIERSLLFSISDIMSFLLTSIEGFYKSSLELRVTIAVNWKLGLQSLLTGTEEYYHF